MLEKGYNLATYWQNFANDNQVIYILDTLCDLNIRLLDQAVLQIFFWQGSIGL